MQCFEVGSIRVDGMTEFDLYYQYVLDIVEMIVYLREKTPEQRMQWKKDCIEYAESLSPSVCAFIRKALLVIDSYIEKDESVV